MNKYGSIYITIEPKVGEHLLEVLEDSQVVSLFLNVPITFFYEYLEVVVDSTTNIPQLYNQLMEKLG